MGVYIKERIVVLCLLLAAMCVNACAQDKDFIVEDGVLLRYEGSAEVVTVPAHVTAIGDEAFWERGRITSISLPSALTSIGKQAFAGCHSLASINIPAKVTSIGEGAFRRCWDLAAIEASRAGKVYTSKDGILFNKALTELIVYPAGKKQASYAVPDTVTGLGESAFYQCVSLVSVSLPESVTDIGKAAFAWCKNLASIRLPASVTRVGSGAFASCESLAAIEVSGDNRFYASVDGVLFNKALTKLAAYPGGKGLADYTVPDAVAVIGDEAFSECDGLASVSLPEGLMSIGESAFEGCSDLVSINLPEGLRAIGTMAFYACRELTSLSLPSTLTGIGEKAFVFCFKLAAIEVDGANKVYASNDGVLFNKTFTVLVAYPQGKKRTSYAAPDTVTVIGAWAFAWCGLYSVSLPEGLRSIGNDAFLESSIASINIPSTLISIEKYAFAYCSLISVSLPESLTSIGERAFQGCGKLASILFLAQSPPSLGGDVFWHKTRIYVPVASLAAYQSAPGWQDYSDQLDALR